MIRPVWRDRDENRSKRAQETTDEEASSGRDMSGKPIHIKSL